MHVLNGSSLDVTVYDRLVDVDPESKGAGKLKQCVCSAFPGHVIAKAYLWYLKSCCSTSLLLYFPTALNFSS
jgi:hypothetical protein